MIRHQRADGGVEARFEWRAGSTRIAALRQAAPLRLLLPTAEPDEWPCAAFLNTGGGLAGGDHLRIRMELAEGCGLTTATAAAEKIYRSMGDATRISTALQLAPQAAMAWLPQETILFDGARLERHMEIDLDESARLLALEMLVFGRIAHGEAVSALQLRDAWRIRRGGRLLWADVLRLDDAKALAAPLGLGGAECMATVICVGPQASGLLPMLREALPADALRAGCTMPAPGLVLARLLGGAAAVRAMVAGLVPPLRASLFGQPARLPRLWTN